MTNRPTVGIPEAIRAASEELIGAATALRIAGRNLKELDCYNGDNSDSAEIDHWVSSFSVRADCCGTVAGWLSDLYPALGVQSKDEVDDE